MIAKLIIIYPYVIGSLMGLIAIFGFIYATKTGKLYRKIVKDYPRLENKILVFKICSALKFSKTDLKIGRNMNLKAFFLFQSFSKKKSKELFDFGFNTDLIFKTKDKVMIKNVESIFIYLYITNILFTLFIWHFILIFVYSYLSLGR